MERIKTLGLLTVLLPGCAEPSDTDETAPDGSTGVAADGDTGEPPDDDGADDSTGTVGCSSCDDGACIEGECRQTCEPTAPDCPESMGCSALEDDSGESVWACEARGDGEFFDPCTTDADCDDRLNCIDDGIMPTCQLLCGDSDVCGSGGECLDLEVPLCVEPRWQCLGDDPPLPSQETAELEVQAIDIFAGGLEGATVRLCAEDDEDCSDPLGTGVADEEGRVAFTVELGDEGFRGYAEAEFDGYLSGSGYRWAAITGDGMTIQVPLVTQNLALLTGATSETQGALLFLISSCIADGQSGVGLGARADVEGDWFVRYAAEDQSLDPELEATSTASRGVIGLLDPGTQPISFLGPGVGVFAQGDVRVRPGETTYVVTGPVY